MAEILVVDDDENMCAAFEHFLTDEGHSPTIVSSGDDAIDRVQNLHPDLVIMDVRMPGMDGLETLKQIKAIAPSTYVVIMTAYGSSQTSIEAMRQGAFDYLNKPLDLDDLRDVIGKALQDRSLSHAVEPNAEDPTAFAMVNLIGNSGAMQEAYKTIGVLTTNSVPALLVGEQGTGRELVARTIHYNSTRKDRSFLAVDCRALGENALDVELFGREAGQQLGVGKSEGRLVEADGGTVLIKDIVAMPPALQLRLSRFLKDGGFSRPGRTVPLRPDVRIIATTDRDLAEDVRNQSFSHDLYDALRVITIRLPPLRQRIDDLPHLVDHFLRRFADELEKQALSVDPKVMGLFNAHEWPGNVAELENVMKRACIMARGHVITVDDIGESLGEGELPAREETDGTLRSAVRESLRQRLVERDRRDATSPFHELVGMVEETLAREAVEITGGNQVKAAEILGLNRTTLRKKLKIDK